MTPSAKFLKVEMDCIVKAIEPGNVFERSGSQRFKSSDCLVYRKLCRHAVVLKSHIQNRSEHAPL